MSLGYIIQQSVNIVVLEVEKVDNQGNIIHSKKVKDLKGVSPFSRLNLNLKVRPGVGPELKPSGKD